MLVLCARPDGAPPLTAEEAVASTVASAYSGRPATEASQRSRRPSGNECGSHGVSERTRSRASFPSIKAATDLPSPKALPPSGVVDADDEAIDGGKQATGDAAVRLGGNPPNPVLYALQLAAACKVRGWPCRSPPPSSRLSRLCATRAARADPKHAPRLSPFTGLSC